MVETLYEGLANTSPSSDRSRYIEHSIVVCHGATAVLWLPSTAYGDEHQGALSTELGRAMKLREVVEEIVPEAEIEERRELVMSGSSIT